MSTRSLTESGMSMARKAVRSKPGKLGLAGVAGMAAAAVTVPVAVRRLDRRRHSGWEGEDYASPPGKEMGITSADGTPLRLIVHGDGDKTIFFVHGWTCNHTIYRWQQRYFMDGYKVVTLNLRGHGESGIPAGLDYQIDRMAEDLKAAVDAVDPGDFVVAGHSMGGFTAFRFFKLYAEEYRGRLKGMVIIDSSGLPLHEGVLLGWLVRMTSPFPLDLALRAGGYLGRLADPVFRMLKNTSLAYLVVRALAFGRKPAGDDVELVREMTLSTRFTSLCLAAKTCIDVRNQDVLPGIDVPVLMLMGRHDLLTNVKVNEASVALMPEARLVVYPDAGHCCLLEARDEFNAELAGFFKRVF
jgi:pimeloyl-ACP methyl ester carboxylesterase